MKMSTVLQAVGYPSNLVREEQEREQALGEKETDVNAVDDATQKSLKPVRSLHSDFPFSVQRDFADDSIELAIEVIDYTPPGDNGSLHHQDPNYQAGEVTFGSAVVVSTSKTLKLTEMEWEAVEAAFWNQ